MSKEKGNDGDTLLYGQGLHAWKPAPCMDPCDGDYSLPGMAIALEYRGERSYARLTEALKQVVERDNLHVAHYYRKDNHALIIVTEKEFEQAIKPRIERRHEVTILPPATRLTTNDKPEIIMQHRVRALLFEKGWKAWDAHPSELTGNEYCRAFSAEDLKVGTRSFSLKEIAKVAQDILQQEVGIAPRNTYGVPSLRSFSNERLGQCYFALTDEDYPMLKDKLAPRSAGELANNILHPMLGKTYEMRLANERKQTASGRGA